MPSSQDLVWSYVRERREAGDYVAATAVNVRCDLLAFTNLAGVPASAICTAHVEQWVSWGKVTGIASCP